MTTETAELNLDDIDLSDVLLDSPTVIAQGQPAETASKFEQPEFPPKNQPARGEMHFDLETVPDDSRRPLFGLDEPVVIKPFTNPPVTGEAWVEWMKRPIAQIKEEIESFNPDATWLEAFHAWERKEKKPRQGILDIVKAIRTSRNPSGDGEAEKTKKMSVTPEYCRIVAMGIGWCDQAVAVNGAHDVVSGFVVDDNSGIAEIELLEWFWESVKSVGMTCGFNILGFDLPVIFARSAILGVTPSRKFDMRPWGADVLDLMKARWPTGPAMKMKDAARLYGIDIPAGDVDGSQVAELFRTDPQKLAGYVKSDVVLSIALRRKWRGYFC